jgi:hypothetical protein
MKTTITILIIGLIYVNNYTLSAQNAPILNIGAVETYNDTEIVPITVTEFSNIGGCDLLFNYDPTVATAASVSLGPGVGQFFYVTDIETPGVISLSWLFFQYGIPGLTLADSSVFLNIAFERVGYGFSTIEFDNSLPDNCLFTDGNFDELNDTPHSTYYMDGSITFEMINAPVTYTPVIETCPGGTSVDLPVTASDFYQIGAFNLTLQFDVQVFTYQSFTNDSGFPGLEVSENNPGTIVIDGLSDSNEGITLDNNSILCTIHFNNLGGSTTINWLDIGESCEYKGPAPDYELLNDLPQSSFYINGSFTELPFPSSAGIISGPIGGIVCMGSSGVPFSISPIANADSYEWTLPEEATIESGEGTHEISVSFSENAVNGDISVYGINECGNGIASPDFPIIIEEAPSISIQPVSPDTLSAGSDTASFTISASGADLSYQWQEYNDTWTNVSNGGVYSGSTTSILTITNPPVSMDGYSYRCIVNGNCEPPAISDGNAVLTVVVLTGADPPDYRNDHWDKRLKVEAYPNPFSEKITFTYTTPSSGEVIIEIANIYGERVEVLVNKIETKGDQMLLFDSKELSQGIYIASITFKSEKTTLREMLKLISNKQ